MQAIFEKRNSSFPNMKIYFDTYLRVINEDLLAGKEV
jgi:hypothetical protein